MTSERKNFNPQATTVTGFLGGVTFTALILLFVKADTMTLSIPYVNIKLISILIPLTAIVSFLFILGTLGTLRMPVEGGSVHKKFYDLSLSVVFIVFPVG